MTSGSRDDATDPAVGGEGPRVIAHRYEVVRVLGEGASARTLLCHDRESGGQLAVKELHFEHLGNWKYLELFEREATVLSRLDHRGIPKVIDFFPGEHTAHTLFIVQEFIEGPSLKQRMETGPMLGQHEVLEVALGLLDVLDYLHGRAPPVLHRDIKPSNVLLRPAGDAVLVDFGGVCFGWRPPNHTGTTVVGTFGYMPPEQLLGQGGPTSDLYALGATLLHLVTGKPPSEFPFDSGRIEVPANLPIDGTITSLIEALLRPAPRDRPQTASDAREILTGKRVPAVVAAPDSSLGSPDTTPPATKHRSVAIMAGDGPRFVDMGSPPRDPKGEFRDVYRNLVNPLFPAKMLWSVGAQMLGVAVYGVLTVVTAGIWPTAYVARVVSRKREYGDLFRYGEFTHGTILAAEEGTMYATFKYEFQAAGSTYIAFIDYANEMKRYWNTGDTVPVLYDPADPQRCCFVYR